MDGYVAESPNPETYVEQRAYASGNTYADRFLSIKQQSSFSREPLSLSRSTSPPTTISAKVTDW